MTRFPKKKNPGISLWFRPNTLRRLSAKLAVRYWAHPRRFFSHLAALGLFNFLRLLRQREFAWLEDWFGVTFSGGVRNSPHPYVSLPVKARIALVVKVTPLTRPLLDRTLKSLQAQTRDAWHAFILDDLERSGGGFPEWDHRFQPRGIAASPVLDVLTEEKWDYLGFLEAGDILAPSALEQMLAPTRESEAPDLIYSDDEIPGRHPYQRRFHKPDWSPELLVSFNYIGDFFLVHPKHLKPWSVKRAWTPFDLYQILLGVLDKNIRVRHVPEVLFFHAVRRPAAVLTKSEIPKSNLRHNLAKVKRGSSFGENKADHPAVKGKPKVSILLLTALRKPVLLHRCLRSLMERTTYA
ncbi:MAG: hypothetical protein HGA76_11825, partial [Candidatus Firestonebacteria bacterium]|nr:hypothetical protein [Candidatus Firestonebacteria bacterium]